MLCVIWTWCSLVLCTAGGICPRKTLSISSVLIARNPKSLHCNNVQCRPALHFRVSIQKNITDALISSSADFIWTAKDWEVTANLWFKIKRVTAQPSFKKLISALWYSLGRKLLLPYICLIKRLSSPTDKLHPDVQFHPFFFCAHWKSAGTG